MRISFHKHEVAGAWIAFKKLDAFGFSATAMIDVNILVKNHQFRADPGKTKDSTYRRLLRRLESRENVDKLLTVMRADRAGNEKNKHKPPSTWYHEDLSINLHTLCKDQIWISSLCINSSKLTAMGIDDVFLQDEILERLAVIIQNKPSRNNVQFVTEFVRKHYLEKNKDDNRKGIPHW